MSSVSRNTAGPEEDGWWPDPWRSGEFRFFKDGSWTSQLKTKDEVDAIRKRHADKAHARADSSPVAPTPSVSEKKRREPPRRRREVPTAAPVARKPETSASSVQDKKDGVKKPPPGRVKHDKKLPPVVDKGPQGETPLFPDLKTDKPKVKKAPPTAGAPEAKPEEVKQTSGKKKPPPTPVDTSKRTEEQDEVNKEQKTASDGNLESDKPKVKKAPPVSVVKTEEPNEVTEAGKESENEKLPDKEDKNTWGKKDSGASAMPTWKSKVKELQSNIDRNWVLVAILSALVLLGPVLIPSEKPADSKPQTPAAAQTNSPQQNTPKTQEPAQVQSFSYTNKKCEPIEKALEEFYNQEKKPGMSKQMTNNLAKAVSTHKLPKNIEKAARADQKIQNLKRTAQLCGVR